MRSKRERPLIEAALLSRWDHALMELQKLDELRRKNSRLTGLHRRELEEFRSVRISRRTNRLANRFSNRSFDCRRDEYLITRSNIPRHTK